MKITFMCCFCGDGIGRENLIGVTQNDAETGSFVQQWWAHRDCFRQVLHESARIFPDDMDWEDAEVVEP